MTKKRKFMHSAPEEHMKLFRKEAKKRGGIEIQELLRAVIIPEWLEHEKSSKKKKK